MKNNSQNNSKKGLTKLQVNDLYTSIDVLPIYNWNKIQQTGNLNYLFTYNNLNNSNFKEELNNIWLALENQYIERYDVSEFYKKKLNLKCRIAEYKIDFYINNKKSARTFWRIEEQSLKELLDEQSTSFEDSIILIEKQMKFQLNERTLSTQKYFDYIKHINSK